MTHPAFVAKAAAVKFVDVNRVTLELADVPDKAAFLSETAERCGEAPFVAFDKRLAVLAGGALRVTTDNWTANENAYLRTTVQVPDTRADDWSHVLVTAEDLTEQKRAEDALRESQELLRLIADNLPASVAYVGQDERIRFVNKQ